MQRFLLSNFFLMLSFITYFPEDVLEPPITVSVTTLPQTNTTLPQTNTPQPGISQPSSSGTLQTRTSAGVATTRSVPGVEMGDRSGVEVGAAPAGTAMYMSVLLATMLVRLLHRPSQVTPFD